MDSDLLEGRHAVGANTQSGHAAENIVGNNAVESSALVNNTVPLALDVSDVSKIFGTRKVLREVTMTVRAGEVRGLLGQNGSGKSTLIKILSGYYTPDSGSVRVGGQALDLPVRPSEARRLGLSFVHQDLALVNGLTVMENLRIGKFTTNFAGAVDWRRELRLARESLDRFEVDVSPAAKVGELTDVDRALVAIVRALDGTEAEQGSGLLVLDEPTVFLPRDGVRRLFDAIRRISAAGTAVMLVSHRIEEIQDICDSVTVLRDGELVASADVADTDERSLVEMILGRSLSRLYPEPPRESVHRHIGDVTGLSGKHVHDLSFALRSGEVVGLTGLAGMGWEEVPYLLFGGSRATAGEIRVAGQTLSIKGMHPADAMRLGIAMLPANRPRDSGTAAATVRENVTLPTLRNHFRRGTLQLKREREDVGAALYAYRVTPPDPEAKLGSLSGGNQQKALVSKWLRTRPRVLVLHEPTQGVDVGSREQIFAVIRAAADSGCTVILVSGEHEHHAHLCDRVLVFRNGRVTTEMTGSSLTADRILESCYFDDPSDASTAPPAAGDGLREPDVAGRRDPL